MNSVNIIGRIVRKPSLRYVPNSGRAVSNFTVAVDKQLSREKQEELEKLGKYTADFIDVVAWEGLAENVAQYLDKGSRVGVTGRLQSGRYENDKGDMVYTTEVSAYTVDFLDTLEESKARK